MSEEKPHELLGSMSKGGRKREHEPEVVSLRVIDLQVVSMFMLLYLVK